MPFSSFQCPSCSARSPLHLEEPVVFGCPHCGAVYQLDAAGAVSGREGFAKTITAVKPDWMLPGAQLDIDQKRYTVAAVYAYGTNWEEYDSEDGWERGYAEYLEWFLIAEDGTEMFLEENDSGPAFFERKETPLTERHIEMVNAVKKPSASPEQGDYALVAFKGADDEPLDRSTWQYKVLRIATGDVTVEWQSHLPSAQWKAFKHRPVSKLDLEKWRVRSTEEIAQAAAESQKLAFFRDVFGIATLVFLALLLWSWIGGKGEPLIHDAWNFSAPNDLQIYNDTSAFQRLYIHSMGTARLEAGVPYRFQTDCSFDRSNSSAEFFIDLLRLPSGERVNSISANFYTESGVDSEGAWTESTLSDYFYFHTDEPGEYEVVARIQPDNDLNEGHSGQLIVRVYPTILSRYFIVFFILSMLAWLIFQWRWEYAAIRADKDVASWLRGMFTN